jgi:hypothetical protein
MIACAAGLVRIALHPWLLAPAPATIGVYALTGYFVGTSRTRAVLLMMNAARTITLYRAFRLVLDKAA